MALDEISATAKVAYGLRLLRNAYTGQCLRVRRSSDNAEQDIGFDGESLDWASAVSFAGGDTLFLTKWYDQSGNAIDAAQSNTTLQPVLDLINLSVDLTQSIQPHRGLIFPAIGLSGDAEFTVTIAVSSPSSARNYWYLGGAFTTDVALNLYGNSSRAQVRLNSFDSIQFTPWDYTTESVVTVRKESGGLDVSTSCFINGVLLSVFGSPATLTPNLSDAGGRIWYNGSGAAVPDGYSHEFVIFDGANSDDQIQTYDARMKTFYGF